MKSLVIHIGAPKTGSSAIQVFLARNWEALRQRSVDYLQIGEFTLGAAGRISSGNGAFISRCLLPLGAPARINDGAKHIGEFLDRVERSECDVGIISSELFSDADPALLREFTRTIRAKGVMPMCFFYVRSQGQFLSSAYIQQVKRHGCVIGPDPYVRAAYKNIEYLKYKTFFDRMRQIFGDEAVVCRTYEGATRSKIGLFTAFLEALQVPTDGLDYAVNDVNTSLSPREIALMLRINRLGPRMVFSDMVVQNSIALGAGTSGAVHSILSPVLRTEIDDYFREENSLLAREYFNRSQLFLPSEGPVKYADVLGIELSVDDIVLFMGGLIVRLDERLARLERQTEARPAPAG